MRRASPNPIRPLRPFRRQQDRDLHGNPNNVTIIMSSAALTPEELAALPHDNAAPRLLASIWTLAFISTVFLALRIYCRLLRSSSLWWDDGILIAAWVSNTTPTRDRFGGGGAD